MSAWKEMMTQEEAMNMSNEQAVQILIPMRNMMCDQNGCPISDAVFALDKAIESLSADVAPVRHGNWDVREPMPMHDIKGNLSWGNWYVCTGCGFATTAIEGHITQYKYCPSCGARMDGDDNE